MFDVTINLTVNHLDDNKFCIEGQNYIDLTLEMCGYLGYRITV